MVEDCWFKLVKGITLLFIGGTMDWHWVTLLVATAFIIKSNVCFESIWGDPILIVVTYDDRCISRSVSNRRWLRWWRWY